jgi:hypothetical protein
MITFGTDAGATCTNRTGASTSNGSVHVLLSVNGGKDFATNADLGTVQADDQPTVTAGAGGVWVTWTDGTARINASGATPP